MSIWFITLEYTLYDLYSKCWHILLSNYGFYTSRYTKISGQIPPLR